MLATKNRARAGLGLILAMAYLMTACSPPGPRALIKGKKLCDAGNYAAAVPLLESATSLMPTNAAAWNYLGLAYHQAGQGTNAAAAYARALALNRDLLEARFNLGCLWLDENKLEAARQEFTTYTMRRANAPEGWFQLGQAQLRATNSSAAERSFRAVINLSPKSAEAYNGLGLAQRQRGRSAEAVQSFMTALKHQSNYGPALLNLATVSQQDLHDPSEALRRYREYLALEPRSADWDTVNALVHSLTPAVLTQPNRGSNGVTRAVMPPNAAQPPTNSGRRVSPASKSNMNPGLAKPSPAPVVTASQSPATLEARQSPPEPVVKLTAEISRTKSVRTSTAAAPASPASSKTSVDPAVVLSPSDSLKLATNVAQEELHVRSDTVITSEPIPIAEVPPTTPGRYSYLAPPRPLPGDRTAAERALFAGQQAKNVGRVAEALQAYRRACHLDGSYFEAHYRLGLAAFEARSFRLALSAWETALALRPDSAEARYNFALTLKAANYPKDAANELEKLLALHPDEARGHLTLGNVYAEQLRDIPRARLHYGRLLQLDPRNPQAQAIRYWLVANPG